MLTNFTVKKCTRNAELSVAVSTSTAEAFMEGKLNGKKVGSWLVDFGLVSTPEDAERYLERRVYTEGRELNMPELFAWIARTRGRNLKLLPQHR